MTTTLVDNRNDLRKHFCATAMSDICGETSHQILPEHICLFLDSAWKKGGDYEPDPAMSAAAAMAMEMAMAITMPKAMATFIKIQ